jgi:DNA-binding NtrC family response regulator
MEPTGTLRLEMIQQRAIMLALAASRGNQSRAAKLLGMSRRWMVEQCKKLRRRDS